MRIKISLLKNPLLTVQVKIKVSHGIPANWESYFVRTWRVQQRGRGGGPGSLRGTVPRATVLEKVHGKWNGTSSVGEDALKSVQFLS